MFLNQRYVYKIDASYLAKHKWNINLKDIRQCVKNKYIVSVGDSTGFRMIRSIEDKKNYRCEERINDIKEKIKKLKKDLNNRENKIEYKRLIKLLDEAKLEYNICNVVFNTKAQYKRASKKGFTINGIKYKLLLGTTGGIKNNTVMFINEKIHEELIRRIYNNFNRGVPMIPSKLMSYMALLFSQSIPVTSPRKILVVKDVETKFKTTTTKIKFNDELDRPDVWREEDTEVTINACDGCGMITPQLAEQWGKDLRLDYTPVCFCGRNSWLKGILTSFDFKKYCKEVIKQEIVTDVWGNQYNINDVDMILNESMLKCWKGYTSIEQYMSSCEEHGYTFSVTKFSPKELEKRRTTNYQYLQCLKLSDEDINNLLQEDIQEIKDVLGLDYRKTILFCKGQDLTDKNVWIEDMEEDKFVKALMINGEAINDEYIKKRINNLIRKRIKLLKTGKVNVEGNYQIIIGEPVIQLESMFGLEPKGLLNSGEYYIEYWRDKGVYIVGCFRSPMSCKSNAKVANVCNREEVIKWYGHLKNVIIFNAWDTSMMAYNGADFDGDLLFTTSNQILINGIYKDEPAIDCEGKSSNKISNISRQQFIDCIYKSFGNKVGSVTNVGSSCYNKIALFEEDSEEYKELDYRIKCIQYYQQECIDSAKNGTPPKPLPSYWTNDSDDVEQLYKNTLVDKKPYYFIYIYNTLKAEYNKFLKSVNCKCYMKFGMSYEELLKKSDRTLEEEDLVNWGEKINPISKNDCVVNKIASIVEKEFDNKKISVEAKEFDYSIYYTDDGIGTTTELNKLTKLAKELSSLSQSQCVQAKYNGDKENNANDRIAFKNYVKTAFSLIIPNENILLNSLVYLAYEKNKIGKWVLWNVCDDMIINNLLKKNNNIIHYPIKDEQGNIIYDGKRFSMTSKKL